MLMYKYTVDGDGYVKCDLLSVEIHKAQKKTKKGYAIGRGFTMFPTDRSKKKNRRKIYCEEYILLMGS